MDGSITRIELEQFKEAVHLKEMPLVAFSTDKRPEEGLPVHKAHCVMAYIRMARKKHASAFFSRDQPFCPGGQFYLNVIDTIPEFIPAYVSTGLEGVFEGERYCQSPQVVQRYLEMVKLDPDPRMYRVFKPIDMLKPDETPEMVLFFAEPDILAGLYTLVQFYTGERDAVVAPWGAGCTTMYTWVKRYLADGLQKAVLGGFDASARPFLERCELSFSMPYAMFQGILECYRESFIFTKSWGILKRRIAKGMSGSEETSKEAR
jgi:uncharacterized protein (DUF169 family)